MDWVFNTEYLVCSGGGTRAYAFLGAYQVLEEEFKKQGKDLSSQVHGFAGSSAGTLFSLLLVLGFQGQTLTETLLKSPVNQVWNDMDVMHYAELWGFNDKTTIVDFIRHILKEKTGNADVTFQELFVQTNKTFVVAVSRVNDSVIRYHSHISTPEFVVWSSVAASISIPVVFTPTRHGKELWVDGAVLDNCPMSVFPYDRTTGICLQRHLPFEIQSRKDYLGRLLYMAMNALERYQRLALPEAHRHRVIDIDTGEQSSVDFALTDHQKIDLIRRGAQQMYLRFAKPMHLLPQALHLILQSAILTTKSEETQQHHAK